ncbi:hypothetical protein DID88_004944 [Monilinia fructigena]|uniref:Carbonic anhydrase n=1 Tax=Monilinia fructigena TaxID=38457 RepID=A0A395IS10_9HELO|nr:hypothetical protein DID88_004944 [Monilinia fructigena]
MSADFSNGTAEPAPYTIPSETSIQKNLVESNKAYVTNFNQGDLALPPAKKYAVVTCMDARIDPSAAFGVALGDAHISAMRGVLPAMHCVRLLFLSNC